MTGKSRVGQRVPAKARARARAPRPAAAPGPARRPLAFAVKAMRGKVLQGSSIARRVFSGAASDSREVGPGRLFFALRGERVDGFDYCAQAAAAGAAAVVVNAGRGRPVGCDRLPVIAVRDARRALGDLARAVRRAFVGKVIGVTGSNGKTTTKELIAAALAAAPGRPGGVAGRVLRTAGNLNTDVGLPLTVLEASGREAFWVLEMAMRARGEIAYLADIARPHVGLVTNVAAAHLGRLGSLDEVARAKGEIFRGLAPGGIAVLPADEPRLDELVAHLPRARQRRFAGLPGGAEPHTAAVRILDLVPAGAAGATVRLAVGAVPVIVRLPLAGEHNARNAAAALAVASALGVPVLAAAEGIARAKLPPHRSRVLHIGGRTVLDDCYNANPASMSAALRTLADSTGGSRRGFALLGDMLELGDDARALHTALGREVAAHRLAGLATVGSLGADIAQGARDAGLPADRVLATDDPAAAAVAVARWSAPTDWILVKASRGMRFERAIEVLSRVLDPAAAKPKATAR